MLQYSFYKNAYFCKSNKTLRKVSKKEIREMEKENQTPQKGWKSFTRQEKWMVVSIVVLVILVLVRWDYIREEAGGAFRSRIETIQGKGMDSLGLPAMRMPTPPTEE